MGANSAGYSLVAVQALRKLRPRSLRVFLVDGRTEAIAVPDKRTKWPSVQVTLERLHWTKLEALNAKGEILGLIENDEPATGLEDLGDGNTDATTAQVGALLGLLLRAQDVALSRQASIIKTTLEVNAELCNTLMQRLNALEKAHRDAATEVLELKEALAESGGEKPGDMSGKLMEAMAPQLLRKLGGNGKASALDE